MQGSPRQQRIGDGWGETMVVRLKSQDPAERRGCGPLRARRRRFRHRGGARCLPRARSPRRPALTADRRYCASHDGRLHRRGSPRAAARPALRLRRVRVVGLHARLHQGGARGARAGGAVAPHRVGVPAAARSSSGGAASSPRSAAALRSGRDARGAGRVHHRIAINWLVYIWAVQNGHVLDSSLGYFINPLVNVLFGVVLLHERLDRTVRVAFAIAGRGRPVARDPRRARALDRADAGDVVRLVRPAAQAGAGGRARRAHDRDGAPDAAGRRLPRLGGRERTRRDLLRAPPRSTRCCCWPVPSPPSRCCSSRAPPGACRCRRSASCSTCRRRCSSCWRCSPIASRSTARASSRSRSSGRRSRSSRSTPAASQPPCPRVRVRT